MKQSLGSSLIGISHLLTVFKFVDLLEVGKTLEVFIYKYWEI